MSNVIGKCPACEQGEIRETENHFSCNHFKSEDDKCGLTIWKQQYGIEVTEDIVKELIENKKTRTLEMTSKEGNPFSASMVINEHNAIQLSFDTVYLDDIECPNCGGKIVETGKSFICESYFDESCKLRINKTVAGVELTTEQVAALLTNGRTDFIKGFISKNNVPFDAKLELTEDCEVKFDSSIVDCPKCGKGKMKEFPKAYSCSNYKSNDPCEFSVWKNQYGGTVNRANLIQLCTKKETKPIAFTTKDGNHPYKGKLILSDAFVVSMEPIKKNNNNQQR